MISEQLLEIRDYQGLGYKPVVDFGAWRVAVLRYSDDQLPKNIYRMQRHNETDEVFVLLQGRAILFMGEGGEEILGVYAQDMELLKVYNVKKAALHAHTLSEDAVVLIVENVDTSVNNSPFTLLSIDQKNEIIRLAGE